MPSFSLRNLLAVVAIVAAAGSLYAYLNRSPLVDLFGGVRNLEVVRAPTKVEAYRLRDPTGGQPLTEYVAPSDYEVTAGPVPVPDATAAKISNALLSTQTYGWDYAKSCGYPVYGVKVSFYRSDKRLDVYFCFLCNVLAVVRDGKELSGEDFDGADEVFRRAAKALFPDDEALQKLSD